MADDLVVPEQQTLVLDDSPPPELAGSLRQFRIASLDDLVDAGIVRSRDNLGLLLAAAQQATDGAVRRRASVTPAAGRRAPDGVDLRRRDDFLSAAGVPTGEALAFWRFARGIDPYKIGGVDASTPIGTVAAPHGHFSDMFKEPHLSYAFQNVEIGPGGTLELGRAVTTFVCMDLLIRRDARIRVRGSGALISAYSIQGEQ